MIIILLFIFFFVTCNLVLPKNILFESFLSLALYGNKEIHHRIPKGLSWAGPGFGLGLRAWE